jgi:hypothetical protein
MPTKPFIASRRSYAHTKNRLLALSRLRPAVTSEPTRFYELWWVAAALCAAGAVTSIGLTPKRHPAKAETHPPHAASSAAVEP